MGSMGPVRVFHPLSVAAGHERHHPPLFSPRGQGKELQAGIGDHFRLPSKVASKQVE